MNDEQISEFPALGMCLRHEVWGLRHEVMFRYALGSKSRAVDYAV